jgi:hypothetical protein
MQTSRQPNRETTQQSEIGWIGVDLDGTLAHYDHWRGHDHIGEPIPAMLDRVLGWLAEGIEVKIFTARLSDPDYGQSYAIYVITQWCLKHLGIALPVTNVKTYDMIELWDDRCVQVEPNTGIPVKIYRRMPPGIQIGSHNTQTNVF